MLYIFRLSILVITILALTSCRSTRNMGVKKEVPNTTTKNIHVNGNKRSFLNEIEVAPGGKPINNPEKISGTQTTKSTSENKKINTLKQETVAFMNIEKANALQIKYAILMDVVIEKLTNIPLLEVIDKWWGTRYCMGGVTQDCLDCSGFTQIVMRDVFKQMIPRTALDQYNASEKI